MNIPFLVVAQSAGRLSRRLPARAITGGGCLVTAAGILGAIGTHAATSAWTSQAARLPGAARQAAIGQARNVASARISSVTAALGPGHRAAAEHAFTHGYHVAVLAAGLCLIAAAIIAATGLSGNRRRELAPAGTSDNSPLLGQAVTGDQGLRATPP